MNVDEAEILLVEDDAHDAELALRALSKHNLANRVVRVKDGVEALEFIYATGDYQHRSVDVLPRVVLLDLKLPRLDGIEVLRRIRGDERTRLLPVVMLTSSREEQDVIESYELGVNSYIVKPVNFEDFLEAVSNLGSYWLVLNTPPIVKG
jgi:two-component system, response regulator